MDPKSGTAVQTEFGLTPWMFIPAAIVASKDEGLDGFLLTVQAGAHQADFFVDHSEAQAIQEGDHVSVLVLAGGRVSVVRVEG